MIFDWDCKLVLVSFQRSKIFVRGYCWGRRFLLLVVVRGYPQTVFLAVSRLSLFVFPLLFFPSRLRRLAVFTPAPAAMCGVGSSTSDPP